MAFVVQHGVVMMGDKLTAHRDVQRLTETCGSTAGQEDELEFGRLLCGLMGWSPVRRTASMWAPVTRKLLLARAAHGHVFRHLHACMHANA